MKMKHCSANDARSAFTLIELLVVIGIIAILASILLPVMNAAFRKAEIAQAQTEVRALESALKAYINEYHANPTGLTVYDTIVGGQTPETTATGIQVEEGVVRMLRGENNPLNNQNPRRIAFMEFTDATIVSNYFVDPWRQPYKYMLDYNYDGITHIWFTSNSGETNLPRPVAVWSRGPDGSDMNGSRADDPKSW
jgi:prepilin-type N-terminal cleavage/methylation domain-containing protein